MYEIIYTLKRGKSYNFCSEIPHTKTAVCVYSGNIRIDSDRQIAGRLQVTQLLSDNSNPEFKCTIISLGSVLICVKFVAAVTGDTGASIPRDVGTCPPKME